LLLKIFEFLHPSLKHGLLRFERGDICKEPTRHRLQFRCIEFEKGTLLLSVFIAMSSSLLTISSTTFRLEKMSNEGAEEISLSVLGHHSMKEQNVVLLDVEWFTVSAVVFP
jgi:hypothetical protein